MSGSLCFTSTRQTYLPMHQHTCFFLEEARTLMPLAGTADPEQASSHTKLPHGASDGAQQGLAPKSQ